MQPEQFDPARHRVFEIEETRYYRHYVVAEDGEAAERLALEGTDDEASEEADFVATELTVEPAGDEADAPPGGPARWGRRRLTVRQALELIRCPGPAPAMVATDELRRLDGWDWVRLAASAELWMDARGLPVAQAFHAVRVKSGWAVATDGRRMHVTPISRASGLWDAETREPVVGEFPDWRPLSSRAPEAGLELVDLPALWQVLGCARPGVASLPTPAGAILVDADLLAEALLGAAPDGPVLIGAGELATPVRLEFPGVERLAYVMPRVSIAESVAPDIDLGPFVRPLPKEAVR